MTLICCLFRQKLVEFFERVVDSEESDKADVPQSIAEIRKAVIFENTPLVMSHLLRLILWISRNFEKFSESLFQRNEILLEDDLKRMKLKTDFLFRLKDLNVVPNSVLIGGILFSCPSPSPTTASEPDELWPLGESEEIRTVIRNTRILLKEDLFRETASSSPVSRMLMWGTAGVLTIAAKSLHFSNFYFSLRRALCFSAASIQQV